MNTGNAANNALLALTGLNGWATGNNGTTGTGTNSGNQYDTAAYNAALQQWQNNGGNKSSGNTVSFLDPSGGIGHLTVNSDGSLSPYDPMAAGGGSNAGAQPQLSDFPLASSGNNNPTLASSGNPLNSPLLKAINMDESTLEKTPGYQFNLTQGLKATQNAAAARGLGTSGAALKGAASYATGLADMTYQNQFNNAVTNQTNQFNRLNTIQQGGQNAAAGLGGIAQQTGSNIANTITGAGNAQAAGILGSANALSSGFGNAAQYGLIGNGIYGNSSNAFNSDPYADDPYQG